MYTEEELELLQSEPELLDLQLKIRTARLEADEAEVAEWERQYQLDAAIEEPLRRLQNKGKLWTEWSAQWWRMTSVERAVAKSITELARSLLWVEDAEITARELVMQTWLEEWAVIQTAERARYRIITEWVQVWEEKRQSLWDDDRNRHKAAVDDMMWRMFEGAAADRKEIERWEQEIEGLEARIHSKCYGATSAS